MGGLRAGTSSSELRASHRGPLRLLLIVVCALLFTYLSGTTTIVYSLYCRQVNSSAVGSNTGGGTCVLIKKLEHVVW